MKVAAITNLMRFLMYNLFATVLTSVIAFAQLPNFTKPINFSVVSLFQINGYTYGDLMIGTSDGGALFSGTVDSNNAMLTKLSPFGTVEWETILNKDSSITITTISEVEDGKYLACGYIYSTGNNSIQAGGLKHVILIDNNGSILWRMPIDTSLNRYTYDYNPIVKGSNNQYVILTIQSSNFQTYNILPTLCFYNTKGLLVKKIYYDSLHSETMNIHPFLQTKDKGFAALIHCELGVNTFEQLWRMDSNGAIIWKKEFKDVQYSQFGGYSSMIETLDGGFFIATTATVNSPDTTYIILRRLDSLGNEIIKKKYGMRKFNAVAQIQQTPNQDVVMVGYSRNSSQYSGTDLCIFRVSPAGNLRWQEAFGDSTTGDYGTSVAVIDDHTFYIGGGTGKTEDPYSGTRPIVFKISDMVNAVSEQPAASDGIHLFPNPTSTQFTLSGVEGVVSVRVVNALGEEVKSFAHVRSEYSIDVSDLVSGLYFVSIRTAKGAVVKPMMVSR